MLPESVTSRLTVENDDKSSMFSVADLYKDIYRFIGIPIVFDYHHHKFCSGGLSENDALDIAVSAGEILSLLCITLNLETLKKTIIVLSHRLIQIIFTIL